MPLALEGGGPGPGPQQAHWAQVDRGNAKHVPPNPLILEGPSPLASLLLPSPSLLCPWDPHGQRRSWKAEDQTQKPSRLPGAKWAGETPTVPSLIPWPQMVCLSSSSPLLPPSHAPKTYKAGGGPGDQSTRPGSPAGFPGPKWVGGKRRPHLP